MYLDFAEGEVRLFIGNKDIVPDDAPSLFTENLVALLFLLICDCTTQKSTHVHLK